MKKTILMLCLLPMFAFSQNETNTQTKITLYEGTEVSAKCLNELKKMLLVNLSDNNLIKMYNFTTNTSHITDLLLNNNNI